MVRDKRRPVQAIFRDRGSIRSDDQGDGKVYHAVNVAFKRHQVMSKVEWDVYCEVIGELLLAFSHQHGRTQLTCWKELRNLSQTRCDNYAWELLQIIRRSLPESDTTKILVLQALFDDMIRTTLDELGHCPVGFPAPRCSDDQKPHTTSVRKRVR